MLQQCSHDIMGVECELKKFQRSEAVNLRRTDNTMATKRLKDGQYNGHQKTKGQTIQWPPKD